MLGQFFNELHCLVLPFCIEIYPFNKRLYKQYDFMNLIPVSLDYVYKILRISNRSEEILKK